MTMSTTAITNEDGHVVATGVFTPRGGDIGVVLVGVYEDGPGEYPTRMALTLSPIMAGRLADELVAAAEKAVKS